MFKFTDYTIRDKWLSLANRIVVFDPGQTTGIAVFQRIVGNKFELLTAYNAYNWEVIEHEISSANLVVAEKVQQKTANFNDCGVGVMYVITYNANKLAIPVFTQKPSMMKAVNAYANLNEFQEHVCDAVAHGIKFIGIENLKGIKLKDGTLL